ncbi:MAG: hypothetical protein NC816_05045, partial [Candidatus Omnitrophica bacterium]|nr:hypothetical protein [Candidatus Omnitrophota bacterium]
NLPVLNIIRYGKGKIYFLRGLIGQSEPLDEPEGNINLIHQILKRENINPFIEVKLKPIEYTLGTEKGLEKYYEKRNLIIHSTLTDGKNIYLFLHNLFNRSIDCEIKFRDKFKKIINFETGEEIRIENKKINLNIDCKSCLILKLL